MTSETLGALPLFEGVDPARLAALNARVTWTRHDQNALILDFEESSTEVRFILSGRVRAIHRAAAGKEVILGEIGAGEVFGEMSAIDGAERSAAVTALEPSVVGVMAANVFRDLLETEPSVSGKVIRMLVARVRELNQRLAEHVYLTARQRLCAELLRASRPRNGAPTQRVISPPPLQQALADRIGARREVVTRELSALTRAGFVLKERGALVLADPDALNGVVGEDRAAA